MTPEEKAAAQSTIDLLIANGSIKRWADSLDSVVDSLANLQDEIEAVPDYSASIFGTNISDASVLLIDVIGVLRNLDPSNQSSDDLTNQIASTEEECSDIWRAAKRDRSSVQEFVHKAVMAAVRSRLATGGPCPDGQL